MVKSPFVPKESHEIWANVGNISIKWCLNPLIQPFFAESMVVSGRSMVILCDFSDNPALEATSPAAATSNCAIFCRAWVAGVFDGGWDKFWSDWLTDHQKMGILTMKLNISPTKMGI